MTASLHSPEKNINPKKKLVGEKTKKKACSIKTFFFAEQ